jgi:hypothetical protein
MGMAGAIIAGTQIGQAQHHTAISTVRSGTTVKFGMKLIIRLPQAQVII